MSTNQNTEQDDMLEGVKEDILRVDLDIYSPFRIDVKTFSQDKKAWEDYSARVGSLPDSLSKILFSTQTMDYLISIAERFDLTKDQSAALSRIIRDILLGKGFAGDMLSELINKLIISQEMGQAIKDSIVAELLRPVLEDIKKIQQQNFPNRTSGGQTQSAPPMTQASTQGGNMGNIVDLRNQK